jgi:hypothetical protein
MSARAPLTAFLVLACALMASTASAQAIRVAGTGHNLTCDETTGVSMTITHTGPSYRAQGAFDAVNLFGRFDAPGRQLSCEDSPGATCLQFVGTVEFGGDGSGFPLGTRTTFVLTLVIHGNDVHGVYHIGRLPDFDYEQYGTLAAAVTR